MMYPKGITPRDFQRALMVATAAELAELTTAAQMKVEADYRAVVDSRSSAGPGASAETRSKVLTVTPHGDMLSVKQTAKEAKVTRQTVYAAIQSKALKARKVKGEYRVRWSDAQAWFAK
jgi:excisionase family DNA binding protein